MKRSFFTIFLGIFLINIPAFASLSPHPETHEPFDLFRDSIVQISQIARWIDPDIHSILNTELQATDKARNKTLYTQEDYVYLIQKVSDISPDKNSIFSDILSITNSIVHNSMLTLIPLDHTHMDLVLSPGFSHGHVNPLQQMALEKAQCVVQGTYDALQPDARAYASVHIGFSFPQLELSKGDPFKIYEQQYTTGKKFPGWMMLNNMTPIKNEIVGESFHRQAQPLDEDNDAFSPVQQKAGWHNIATTANKAKGEDGSLWLMSHQSFQIYDAISLRRLFESNGFLIEDLFFESGTNMRVEISKIGNGAGRFTSANDAQKVARVCIVARKPSLNLPFNTTCSTTS